MTALPRGIRARGDAFFVDVSHQGKRATATVATVEEARAKRIELLHELVNGKKTVRPGRGWTLGEAFDFTSTLKAGVRGGWAGSNSETHAVRNGQAACDHFGRSLPLASITLEGLDAWVSELEEKGNSDATINRKLAALSKIMTVAMDRGHADKKPRFPRRKESKGRIRFLSRDEENTLVGLLRQWSKDEEADAVVVLVDTGLRWSECARIQPRDLDLANGILSVWMAKNSEPRSVPLTSRAKAILSKRMTDKAQTDTVFDLTHYTMRHIWDRAKAHMGLVKDKQFVIHALRHTCCSRLVQKGVPIKVVQEWMGHKTLTVTMRYAHLCPTNLKAAVKALEAA